LRAADVAAWQDAFAAVAAARAAASQVDENVRGTYAEAFEGGYTEGLTKGESDSARLVLDTRLAVDSYLDQLPLRIAELAMGVVERVVGQLPLAHLAQLVAAAAVVAVAEFREKTNLTVTVHPAVADRVSRELEERALTATVRPDPSRDEDACIVANDVRTVDASLSAQFRSVAGQLTSGNEER
jgi:flagellar biosynthesis/type III secretory pathway protein FliH